MRILSFLLIVCFLGSIVACKKDAENTNDDITLSATDTVVYSGSFVSNAHTTTGSAKIIKAQGGKKYLILDGFTTDSGPDVRVYLAPDKTISGAVEISRPAKNGNSKVEIPSSVNLTTQKFVLIWCAQASVLFGNAPIR